MEVHSKVDLEIERMFWLFFVFLLTLTTGHVIIEREELTTQAPKITGIVKPRIEPILTSSFDWRYRWKIVAKVEYNSPLHRKNIFKILGMLKNSKPSVDIIIFKEMEANPELAYKITFVKIPPFFAATTKKL